MYTLYRRQGSKVWQFRIHNTDIRRSAGTIDKELAGAYAKKEAERYFREVKLGEKPRRLWEEGVVRWINENKDIPSLPWYRREFVWLDPFLRGKPLDEISRDVLETIIDARSKEVKSATINKTIQAVSSVLHSAKKWEWLESVPSIRRLREPKRRIRFLTKEEAWRVINAVPEHLRALVQFSFYAGPRMENAVSLEWSQLDLPNKSGWIHADQAKMGKAIPIPLNSGAIMAIYSQVGKHEKRVFTYNGKPFKKPNGRAWKEALKRAGIENFRWHDMRHTWASWILMAGAPLHAVMEMGGWEDIESVRKYAHFAQSHLADYAERLATLSLVCTDSGTVPVTGEAKHA